MDKLTIRAAFRKFNTDKSSRHNYEQAYAEVFARFTPNSITEIGIQKGRSLLAWNDLFPNAALTGIDITEQFDGPIVPEIEKLNFRKIIHSSFDPAVADMIEEQDIIIDDGDHTPEGIMKTFHALFSKAKYFYVIEDIGGLRHERFIREQIRKATEGTNLQIQTFDSAQKVNFAYGDKKIEDTFKILVVCKDPSLNFVKQ